MYIVYRSFECCKWITSWSQCSKRTDMVRSSLSSESTVDMWWMMMMVWPATLFKTGCCCCSHREGCMSFYLLYICTNAKPNLHTQINTLKRFEKGEASPFLTNNGSIFSGWGKRCWAAPVSFSKDNHSPPSSFWSC